MDFPPVLNPKDKERMDPDQKDCPTVSHSQQKTAHEGKVSQSQQSVSHL